MCVSEKNKVLLIIFANCKGENQAESKVVLSALLSAYIEL